jgi:hypothetical protein
MGHHTILRREKSKYTMSDDEGSNDAEETERKKWLIKAPGGGVEEDKAPKCEECEKLNFLVVELKEQLEAEKRAMDEAIKMVEKMEQVRDICWNYYFASLINVTVGSQRCNEGAEVIAEL